jgi:hypothetical protein
MTRAKKCPSPPLAPRHSGSEATDIMHQLVEKWSQPSPTLRLQDLHTYLRQPLEEDEKIPISQQTFDQVSNASFLIYPKLALTAEKLATLFRVSTDECAPGVERLFLYAVDRECPESGTEDRFHSTWDENISNILTFILSYAQPIRSSNRNTSTALKRPDYGLLIGNYCIFRGEEKGSNSSDDPAQELTDKLKWDYDPLPYILGLSWILLSSKACLCICYRISRNCHGHPFCCNYSPPSRKGGSL